MKLKGLTSKKICIELGCKTGDGSRGSVCLSVSLSPRKLGSQFMTVYSLSYPDIFKNVSNCTNSKFCIYYITVFAFIAGAGICPDLYRSFSGEKPYEAISPISIDLAKSTIHGKMAKTISLKMLVFQYFSGKHHLSILRCFQKTVLS